LTVQRMAMIIGVRPDKLTLYKDLHANSWTEMNAALSAANIRNYSIYLREPENLLFGYWEYVGDDYQADMKVLGEKPITKKWLALTDPCQEKLASARADEWWAFMPEVFHLD
jgi:L-rhamnose mutarotase